MKDMTQGSEAQLIVLFALPMLIGNVFQQLYIVVDSLVVGRYLGKQALAAIGACFPIVFLLIALAMGLTMGASILISQYYGAKDFVRAKKAIDTTYISLFVVGVLLSITGPFLSQTILIQMHTPAEILPLARIFIDICHADCAGSLLSGLDPACKSQGERVAAFQGHADDLRLGEFQNHSETGVACGRAAARWKRFSLITAASSSSARSPKNLRCERDQQ
jgi:hypothetical protein